MQVTPKGNTDKAFAVGVLIVDDNEVWRESAAILCRDVFSEFGEQLNIVQAANAEEGLLALTRQEFHIVLLDNDAF